MRMGVQNRNLQPCYRVESYYDLSIMLPSEKDRPIGMGTR